MQFATYQFKQEQSLNTVIYDYSPGGGGGGEEGTSDFRNGRANVLIWSLTFGLGKIVSGLKFQGPKACLFGVWNLG